MVQKKLVIIGAGSAGVTLANELDNFPNLDITIVERKDHYDMVMQQPRSLVNDAFARESLWNLRDTVTRTVKILQAKNVLAVEGGVVKLQLHSGQQSALPADAVVIATGSTYKSQWLKNNDGLNKEEWVAKMAVWRSALMRSRHAMIIGGGLTGVEIAAEIAQDFPSTKVTVVHKGDKILNNTDKMHRRTIKAVNGLPGSVEFILNDVVSAEETLGENGPQTYTTLSGKKIENVDMVLHCVGVVPNTSFIPAAKLDSRGYIEVDERLVASKLSTEQMQVFAIGDCSNRGKGRALVAVEMGKKLAKGLKSWANGGEAGAVMKKDPPTPLFVSLGRKEGIANFPFVNNVLPRNVKAGGMLVEMQASNLKAKGVGPAAGGKFKLSAQAMAPQPAVSPAPAGQHR